jgi:hypothetical protein
MGANAVFNVWVCIYQEILKVSRSAQGSPLAEMRRWTLFRSRGAATLCYGWFSFGFPAFSGGIPSWLNGRDDFRADFGCERGPCACLFNAGATQVSLQDKVFLHPEYLMGILQNQEMSFCRKNSNPRISSSREVRWWVSTTQRVSGLRNFFTRL